MSCVFRRSMVPLRRTNIGPTRRFNTAGEGSAQGSSPPPPIGDWARRLTKYELHYKQFVSRLQGTGDRKWVGKGPFIGFVGGVFVGGSLFSECGTRNDEATLRHVKSLEKEWQDDSRELKNRLITIQQTVDQLKRPNASYPYTTRPQV
ncbi:hypothetical protein H310_07372 [Aphanomyces invadans]|uniref:Uncharacterized protein n=1 Tax=Aphanomyces invadans TaxID=157072 RepID=A0A024U358_9STRA|nr:hypothetical protein H310_07372 [Aphanomyces invadans]ETW00846.1 hypothetical protein H310_07372 [Aphanomyces invadans]|eukprot:XP_008870981.1 hypothetical protein H310_07372 [Aphanomyces invadans]